MRSLTEALHAAGPGRNPAVVGDSFKCDLSRLTPRSARQPWAATGCFFLPLRLDRRDPVAGVPLVNVDDRSQSDSGQLSDPDRAHAAAFAARRQADLCMRYGHSEQSLNN